MQADKAPMQEQEICVCCGFCCDATLFVHAVLNPGEKGRLPALIEQNVFSRGEKDFFRQPCLYFSDRCTIYHSHRADICGSYRCQMLKDFSGDKISLEQALEVVKMAREIRGELLEQYRKLSGTDEKIHYRQVLMELGKNNSQDKGKEFPEMEYEILLARCNIFEALLIKHFRSADDFEKMIMR